VPFGTTAKVQGSIAVFENVVLNRRNTSNELSVSVMGAQGVTCPPKDFPAKIFVDCEGADCTIGGPIPYQGENADGDTTLYLNRSARSGNGFDIRVDSDTSILNKQVQLIIDGRDGQNALRADPQPNGNKVSATFAAVSLSEGEHTIEARCTDASGNVTESGESRWVVDTEACDIDITAPAADTTFYANNDADTGKAGLQAGVEYTIDGDGCVDQRAATCNPDNGIEGPDWGEYSGSSVMTQVTLADEEDQRICAEVRDRAGNVGIDDVPVKNGINIADMPVLTINSPANDAALAPGNACALTPSSPDLIGVQFSLTLDKTENRILTYKVDDGSDVSVTITGTSMMVCVPVDSDATEVDIGFTLSSSVTTGVDNESRHLRFVTGITNLAIARPAPTDANYRDGAVTLSWDAFPAELTAYEIKCANVPLMDSADGVARESWWTNLADVVTPSPAVTPPATSAQVTFRIGEERHCMVRGRDASNQLTSIPATVEGTLAFRTQAVDPAGGDRRMGATLTRIGDVNGDGTADLLAGGEDGAFLYFGGSTLGSAPNVSFVAEEHYVSGPINLAGDAFGARTAGIGDFNGDGESDFAISYAGWHAADVGSTVGLGRVYVFFGREAGDAWPAMVSLTGAQSATTCEADLCFTGEAWLASFGRGLAPIGDFNGDDRPDFAVGAPDSGDDGGNPVDGFERYEGRVFILLGNTYETGTRPGTGFWNVPVAVPTDAVGFYIAGGGTPGTGLTSQFGHAIAPLGNIDGDPRADFAVSALGAAAADSAPAIASKVFRVSGRAHAGGMVQIASGSITLIDEDSARAGRFGSALTSYRDFYAIAPQSGIADLGVFVGALDEFYVYLGDQNGGGPRFASGDRINVFGPPGSQFGNSGLGGSLTFNPNLAGNSGDLDGDDLDDVAIGMLSAPASSGTAGPAYLFYGSVVQNRLKPAATEPASPDDRITYNFASQLNPAARPGATARSAQLIGDINGDGEPDLAIGEPGANSGAGGVTLLW
jgi:hypothetical protein